MPVLTHLGPAAPCGLTRYESRRLRPGVPATTSSPASSTCTRSRAHVLDPDGATFQSARRGLPRLQTTCDFHPTDVLEDADGSLLVRRHRRLVQALLPDVAAGQAGRARRDLPRSPQGCAEDRRPARPKIVLGEAYDARTDHPARRSAPGRAPPGAGRPEAAKAEPQCRR